MHLVYKKIVKEWEENGFDLESILEGRYDYIELFYASPTAIELCCEKLIENIASHISEIKRKPKLFVAKSYLCFDIYIPEFIENLIDEIKGSECELKGSHQKAPEGGD